MLHLGDTIRPSLLFLCVVCSAHVGLAQRTWIVDASGGPGTTHKDIQPAVDAASDGDTIFVRKGTYTRFLTSKALRILGRPGAEVVVGRSTLGLRVAATIQNLPAGKQFVLSGLRLRVFPMFRRPAVAVTSCKGFVLLERLTIPPNCYYSQGIGRCHDGIHVDSSDRVVITGCQVTGYDGISVSSSTVSIVGCTLRGQDSVRTRYRALANTPALRITNSRVTLSRVTATGGKGGRVYNTITSEPAIRSAGSDLVIAGTAADTLHAGTPALNQRTGTAAIDMAGGSLWLSPSVGLFPNPGAPPVSGTYKRIAGTPVALAATGAPPGGVVNVQTVATPGETAYLLMAGPARPASTPWGALWLDPGNMVLLATKTLGTPAVWTRSIPVPPIPALRSLVVGFQALSGKSHSSSFPMRLSNGLAVVID